MGSSGVVFSTRRRRARASSGETKRKETKRNSQSHTSGLVDDHITIVRAVSSLSRARVHAVLLTRLVPFTFETRSLSNRERSSPVFRAEISKPRRRARGNRSRVTSREDAHVRPTHSAPSRRFSNRSTSRSRGTPRHTGGVSPATPGSVRCLLRPRTSSSQRRRQRASTVRRVDGATRRGRGRWTYVVPVRRVRVRVDVDLVDPSSRRVAGRRDVRDPSRGDTDVESSRDPREETTMRSNAPGSRTRARVGG